MDNRTKKWLARLVACQPSKLTKKMPLVLVEVHSGLCQCPPVRLVDTVVNTLIPQYGAEETAATRIQMLFPFLLLLLLLLLQ